MPSDSKPRPVATPAVLKINLWYRATSVLLRLGGLGSGGAAVYLTHLEAGPVGLLAVGLLLLLVGMSGRLPTRIRVGDNEAAWDAVQEFVDRVTDDAPDDAKPGLINALGDLAGAAPRATSSALSALAYELMISNMLHEFVIQANATGEDSLSFDASQGGDSMACWSAPDEQLVLRSRHTPLLCPQVCYIK